MPGPGCRCRCRSGHATANLMPNLMALRVLLLKTTTTLHDDRHPCIAYNHQHETITGAFGVLQSCGLRMYSISVDGA